MLCRTVSFSVSSPLSVCSFVHGFLLLTLFTVVPNTFMIIGGKAFFLFWFLKFVLPFPLPNPVKSSTHVYVEGFLFMLCCWCLKSFCQRLTRTFLLPKIPEPTLLMGKESFFFLSYVAKCIYHQCSQGILENTFSYSMRLPVAAFTLLFSEQSIWIGQSTLERSLQSLPMPTEEVISIFQQMFLLY